VTLCSTRVCESVDSYALPRFALETKLCQSEHWALVPEVCYGSYVYEMHSRFSESRFFEFVFSKPMGGGRCRSVLGTGAELLIVTALRLVVTIHVCTLRCNAKNFTLRKYSTLI
jgi:hypothetical protein